MDRNCQKARAKAGRQRQRQERQAATGGRQAATKWGHQGSVGDEDVSGTRRGSECTWSQVVRVADEEEEEQQSDQQEEVGGRLASECILTFLDADVKRPLVSVSGDVATGVYKERCVCLTCVTE